MSLAPVEFAQENLIEAWDEMLTLARANAHEAGLFSTEEFTPDKKHYQACETFNLLQLFTARRDLSLIGYGLFLVHPHGHYPDKRVAVQDAFYFKPEARGYTAGKFLIWCDFQLKKMGCDGVIRQVRKEADYSRALNTLGYREVETTYFREF